MKRINILTSIITLFLLTAFNSAELKAQSYCTEFYNSPNCKVADSFDYQPYGQRKGALCEINKNYEYSVVLYGKKDYRITLCTETSYGPVHFRILNAETGDVIYDNEDDDYLNSIGFTNENTKRIIVEMKILANVDEGSDIFERRVCLGVNIMWRKIPRMGF